MLQVMIERDPPAPVACSQRAACQSAEEERLQCTAALRDGSSGRDGWHDSV